MTEQNTDLVRREEGRLTISDVRDQINAIQELMRGAMQDGQHYGIIPGCGTKPSLLKPGAEKISMMFRLIPEYIVERMDLPNGHREYQVTCTLRHGSSGNSAGQGVGSASTMEGKFRFRKANLVCPECGKETIIKGVAEFGGGWLCFVKKGGCGTKWTDDDNPFTGVNTDRVEHDNPADYYNTVLKMAKKRAHVDAVLTATAASDIFTQDVEDLPHVEEVPVKPAEKPAPASPPARKATPAKPAPAQPAKAKLADNTVSVTLSEIGQQEGKNKRGPWLLTFGKGSDGVRYGTFDRTIGARMKELEGVPMTLKIDRGEKGNTILDIIDPPPAREPGEDDGAGVEPELE